MLLQIALGVFQWLTPVWLLSLLAWAAALGAWHLLCQGELVLPYVQLQQQADVESVSLVHVALETPAQ